MSDPARDGYQCHGPMEAITLMDMTGIADTRGTAAFLCRKCGVWRHGFPHSESQLRAIVEARMPELLEARRIR